MTTEIAVLNKTGVALAADSAVTVAAGTQSQKTRNTANKVFALSKHAPVGVMIYGAAEVMGVPWETIIKMYRHSLGEDKFATLKEYCSHFFRYLDRFTISAEAEQHYIERIAYCTIGEIRKKAKYKIGAILEEKGQISDRQLGEVIRDVVKEIKDSLVKLKSQKLTTKQTEQLKQKCANIVASMDEFVRDQDEHEETPLPIPFSAVSLKQISQICFCAALSVIDTRQPNFRFFPENSGVVVAGFGESEIYPSCFNYDVAGILFRKAIRKAIQIKSVSETCGAIIAPFAQSGDVMTFIEGISPGWRNLIERELSRLMTSVIPSITAKAILKKISLSQSDSKKVESILKDIGNGAFGQMSSELADYRRYRYVHPVLDAIQSLQKDELAFVAENFVNMVSFRKQVSHEAETVGGPIDVAVITKGDGLIWIKRKHYFDYSLNHHFFSKYFNAERNEK